MLDGLDIEGHLTECLTVQAARLAANVQARLGEQPGESHDAPWHRSGRLQSSIAVSIDGLTAQVGSNDPAARPQEFGTARIPPRPFILPAVNELSDSIASELGAALFGAFAANVD